MKTIHFRFTTPCSAVIDAESIINDDPCENGLIRVSPIGTARLYDRHPALSQFLERNNESGAYFFSKAIAHGGSCFGVFHYTQFLKYETPKKELKMYDAIAELLKA